MNKEVNEYCESDVYMYLAEVPAKFDDMYCDITGIRPSHTVLV